MDARSESRVDSLDESGKALILRIILMSSLSISSLLFGKVFMYLRWPEQPYTHLPFLFFSLFGPIVSGFYAGMTIRTYRSMLQVCLATSVVASLYFSTIDRMPYLVLIEIILAGIVLLAFFLAFLTVGVISAIAARRLHRRVLGTDQASIQMASQET